MRKGRRDLFVFCLLFFVCFCFGCGNFSDDDKKTYYNQSNEEKEDDGNNIPADANTPDGYRGNSHFMFYVSDGTEKVLTMLFREGDCPDYPNGESLYLFGDFPDMGWLRANCAKMMPSKMEGYWEISIKMPPVANYGFNFGWLPADGSKQHYAWYSLFSQNNPYVNLGRKCFALKSTGTDITTMPATDSFGIIDPAGNVDPNSIIYEEDPNQENNDVVPALDPNKIVPVIDPADPNSDGEVIPPADIDSNSVIGDPNNGNDFHPAMDGNIIIIDPNYSSDIGNDTDIDEIIDEGGGDDTGGDGEIDEEVATLDSPIQIKYGIYDYGEISQDYSHLFGNNHFRWIVRLSTKERRLFFNPADAPIQNGFPYVVGEIINSTWSCVENGELSYSSFCPGWLETRELCLSGWYDFNFCFYSSGHKDYAYSSLFLVGNPFVKLTAERQCFRAQFSSSYSEHGGVLPPQ